MDLREAAFSGNMQAVRKFVEEDGVPINQQNKINGWTALHWATKGNQVSVVRYLLMHGADKSLQNAKGETAADLAFEPQIREILGACGEISRQPQRAIFGITLSETATAPMEDVSAKYQQNLTPEQRQQIMDQTNAFQQQQQQHHQGFGASAPYQPHYDSAPLRVRVKRKREEDFSEIEVPEPSYEALVSAITHEFGDSSRVAKIRKLPNVLVKKDADVQRLNMDQEMEVEMEEN